MSNPAARTAFGPMVIVAVDQYDPRPLIRDELAERFLPAGTRGLVRLARWAPVRRWLRQQTERRMPGLWASMLCRKRYLDDAVAHAVEAGIDAVVVLGAGLDTRSYRLPALAGVPVYEVDLPVNIERKRGRVTAVLGAVPATVHLVAVDFETGALAGALRAAGHSPQQRTLFIWEAVTQYLTEAAVRETFAFLGTAAAGSRLAFTYVRQDFLDGTSTYGAPLAYRDFVARHPLWKFGLLPDQVAGFLAEYGWQETDQAGPREFAQRYTGPAGRDLPVSEIERSVSATR